ncbi:MAG: cation:proton antiporter [Spirochaetota bacterium]
MSNHHIGFLLLFGIAIFGGIVTALLFTRIRMPQVIGYIVTGVIIGAGGINLITADHIRALTPFNYFALGIIGFLVGSEIRFSDLKKYGRQFSMILILEGFLACILVGAAVSLILYAVTGSLAISVAGGAVFGAIASATDPASTMSVIWENRAAGILTTTIIAIVALDDALAMLLYGLGTGVSRILTGGKSDILLELIKICAELGLSVGTGIVGGYLIILLVRAVRETDTLFVCGFGLLLIVMGVCAYFDLDVILASMGAGITVSNTVPERSERLVGHIKALSTPIYILFFVLVGARIVFGAMPYWLWGIVASYVLLRSAGKYAGSWMGARLSGAHGSVQKYTGMSIFAQGGVAIGLSIMAGHHLSGIAVTDSLNLGEVIIFGITMTTFLVQLVGPIAVRAALILSGEAGKNLSEQDMLQSWIVKDHTASLEYYVHKNSTIRDVIDRFSQTDVGSLPVVDHNMKLEGVIPFSDVKMLLPDQSMWDWLIAADFVVPVKTKLAGDEKVSDALTVMDQIHTDELPVVDPVSGLTVGVFNRHRVKREARSRLIDRYSG